MEIGIVLLVLIFIPLFFGGLFVLAKERRNIKDLLGFSFVAFDFRISGFFLALIFFLFYLIFQINVCFGYITYSFNPSWKPVFNALLSSMASSFWEELVYRGIVFLAILNFRNDKILAVVLSSLLFAGFHFPSGLIQFISYFLAGIIYGYAFVKFQSIVIPMIIHAGWNFVQAGVYGFSVSGSPSTGLFDLEIIQNMIWNGEPQGPEGSLIGIAVRLVLVLAIFILPARFENTGFLRF